MTRRGWQRLSQPGAPTCFGRFRHVTGAIVSHCGHQSAIYPYFAIVTISGREVKVVDRDGRGFRRLADACSAIERVGAGLAQIVGLEDTYARIVDAGPALTRED